MSKYTIIIRIKRNMFCADSNSSIIRINPFTFCSIYIGISNREFICCRYIPTNPNRRNTLKILIIFQINIVCFNIFLRILFIRFNNIFRHRHAVHTGTQQQS